MEMVGRQSLEYTRSVPTKPQANRPNSTVFCTPAIRRSKSKAHAKAHARIAHHTFLQRYFHLHQTWHLSHKAHDTATSAILYVFQHTENCELKHHEPHPRFNARRTHKQHTTEESKLCFHSLSLFFPNLQWLSTQY
jgi:hypothetical protein